MERNKRANMSRNTNQKEEHILICLSSSPSNARLIQIAGEMAESYHGNLTALFVETSAYSGMQKKDQERLNMNMQLALSMGAVIQKVSGDDISYQIAEFAKLNGVTKIVLGKTSTYQKRFGQKSMGDRLMEYAPGIEIFIIPDGMTDHRYQRKRLKDRTALFFARDFFKMVVFLCLATGLSLLFFKLGFSDANIITIYILGVLLTSVETDHIIYSVLASMLSVITFNFFFTDPRYTLLAYDIDYPMTFVVMFLASLLTGTLASKQKAQARTSANQAYRTKILLETNQALQQAENQQEIIETTLHQLVKLTGRQANIVLKEEGQEELPSQITEKDGRVCYPIRSGASIHGLASFDIQEAPLDDFENSIVISILGECALFLRNDRIEREKEEAAILAKNEQLRANLLRTISHDLRTPLTSISGNASNLLSNSAEFSPEIRRQLYTDIYDDSMWLINLVENLLSVTRMEGEGVKLHKSMELIDELLTESLKHLDRKAEMHHIYVTNEDELLMVRVDAKLIMQVIINLVNNAIKYTPEGSDIHIHVRPDKDMAVVSIEDNGPGIADERKDKVFELFYSGEKNVADGHRSMGLGLSLCKSIILAHSGNIELTDSPGGGACFTFCLPIEQVELHP